MSGRKAFATTNRGWWAGVTEAFLSAGLLLLGIITVVISVTLAVVYWSPDGLYTSIWFFVLQLVIGVVLTVIGAYCVLMNIWKFSVSAERRGAIVTRAGEIELFNEAWQQRDDLPSIPRDKYTPEQGSHFRFRLQSSRRTQWGLGTSLILATIFVVLATVLVITSITSYQRGSVDWLAIGFAIPIVLATLWSVYSFLRQLLKLTGIGPTTLEISRYPVITGQTFNLHLSQPGRIPLRLVDIYLECHEEATFDEGTNTRTEDRVVYRRRLFRQHDIEVRSDRPFEANFDMVVPAEAMHSFKSKNNRVLWKIVVHGSVQGWPRIARSFAISVLPGLTT